MKYTSLTLCTAACALALNALAQTPPAAQTPPPPPAPGPALSLALEAAQQAIASCIGREQKVGVSVVDSAGVLKVVLGSDGVSPRGIQSSTNKALTALTFKEASSKLGELVKSDKELADKIAANPNFNIRAGGLLIWSGQQIIGAIGVGGARGSENDEACAQAGLDKILSRL